MILENETAMEPHSDSDYLGGYQEGYRIGGCQAVMSRIPALPLTKYNSRILYVTQGFEAIDGGIEVALQKLVKECITCSPESMLEEAIRHRPDLVLVMNALHVFPADHAAQIDQLREMGVLTAVWFVDDPYFSEYTSILSLHYDLVFTHEEQCVKQYKELGCKRVHYLPLGVNPTMFRPLQVTSDYQYDICFIGNAFWNRVELFETLAPFLQDKKVLIAGGHWDRLQEGNQLDRFVRHGWIPVEETVSYYNGAKIVINLHRPITPGQDNHNSFDWQGGSINPRTYEINACGTLQMTDIRDDLTKYYTPDYDIVTYQNVEELQSKLAYYLEHEQERVEIAWRSLWTTYQNHTYVSRVSKLLSVATHRK